MINNIFKNKKARTAIKLITALLTIGIIFMLILSGPANALSLNVSSDKSSVKSGEKVNFDVKIQIPSDQNITSITLVLEGPVKKECVFDINGQKLSACTGISNITVSNSIIDGYGYGYLSEYGYGSEKEFNYKMSIDTLGYVSGDYNTAIKVLIGNQLLVKTGNKLSIKPYSSVTGSRTYSSSGEKSSSQEIKKQIEIYPGKNLRLISDNTWNEASIKSINKDSVIITLNGKLISIGFGETKQIDFNGDLISDISLSIWYLGNDQATLYLNSEKTQVIELNVKDINPKIISSEKSGVYAQYTNNAKEINYIDYLNYFPQTLGAIIMLTLINFILIELIAIVSVVKNRSVKKRRLKNKIKL